MNEIFVNSYVNIWITICQYSFDLQLVDVCSFAAHVDKHKSHGLDK